MTTRCLKLLGKCKNAKHLKRSHAQVITCGLGNNSFALSRLLAFCSNPLHDSVHYGFIIFNQIKKPTVCIYNTMIKTFLLNGELINTVEIYNSMLKEGVLPDNYTLPYLLKACASLRVDYLGESVHGHCLKFGFVSDIFVGNTLIVMYSAFDNMRCAHYVFDEIPVHTEVTWTVMISGFAKQGNIEVARLFFDEAPVKDRGIWGSMISSYVQNNCFKEGLYLFRLMQLHGVAPDEAIFVSVLSACAQSGALEIGIWIHGFLTRFGSKLSVRMSTGLIDMYAKCGHLDLAKKVFDEIIQRDTVCWNVMISAMAMNGDGHGAVNLFLEMERTSIKPDELTFIPIFTACNYSSMAEEGIQMLNKMCNVYNIEPTSEHYVCIVDLISRAGLLEEAKGILENLPSSPSPYEEAFLWRALLSGCCNYEQTQLAEIAAEKLLLLERHSGVYVLLSNLYAGSGKHDDARRLREMMRSRGVQKKPGCSLVEINGVVHEFVAGEKTHPHILEVDLVLVQLKKLFDCSNLLC